MKALCAALIAAGALPGAAAVGRPIVSRDRPIAGLFNQLTWDKLRGVVIFIGTNRTGSDVVAALLNAHPRVLIPNEYDLLDRVHRKPKVALYQEMHQLAVVEATKHRSYAVEGQWQGRVENNEPYLIGDKKVVTTELELMELTLRLRRLAWVTRLPLKVVHLKHPPAEALQAGWLKRVTHLQWFNNVSLRENNTQAFLEMLQKEPTIFREPAEVIPLDLTAMQEEPELEIPVLCEQLGIACAADYVAACADMIRDTPVSQWNW